MVKGVSRRVIVIRSPQSDQFEQAIFILKDGHQGSLDVVQEACRIARDYTAGEKKAGFFKKLPGIVYCAFGALTVAILWAASVL